MHPHYCTAFDKLIKRLSACKFVSRSEKYRRRSDRKFGLKRTERSERSLKPCVVGFRYHLVVCKRQSLELV